MSNEEVKQQAETENIAETEKPAKVMTKYDLKMERRAKEKEQEARSILIWKIVGIVIILAIVGLALSFPARKIYARNKTLFTVGDNKITPVEYDYYYSVVVSNYFDSYGTMLSYYYGIEEDSDFSTVSYSDTMTFADYFQELTAEQMQQNEGLKTDMEAAGRTYDATDYYNTFIDSCTTNAESSGVTLAEYLQSNYGEYATAKNLKPIIEESYALSQYYQEVYDGMEPSDEEIQNYYGENKDSYDSVDYYLYTVSAELPTEPTELADEEPVYDDDNNYTPSDAEVEAAMAAAKETADGQVSDIKEIGTLHTGELSSDVSSYIKSWLFDAERTAGDTTVIENSYSDCYYIVEFENRFLSDACGVDIRVIITSEDNGDEIVSAINDGGATLDSFLAALDEYDEGTADGGLYEDIDPSNFSDEINEWLTSADRKEGDIQNFYVNESYTYVMYFISQGDPIWKTDIASTMTDDTMEEYLTAMEDTVVIKDPKKFLTYLVLRAEEEAASTETTADETSTDTTDTTSDTATSDTTTDAE